MQALEISNLVKTYENNVTAVKGINLTVNEGEFFALLGPNGAGKSTTIGMICSLVNITSGQIKVQGHDLAANRERVKTHIGLVPQEFNFNIFESVSNILLNQAGYYGVPRKVAQQRAEKYLNKLELWSKRNDASRTLSGGLKRRLMIARALMHEPELLILDEPTAGVDIEIRRSMWQFLQDLNQDGRTIILTTHYLEEAEHLCNQIAIIDQGRIIENLPIKTLLSKLDLETFVFDLVHVLDAVPTLSSFDCRLKDETTLEVDVPKQRALNEVFSELSRQKIYVASMRNKSNRLEELFLSLTS